MIRLTRAQRKNAHGVFPPGSEPVWVNSAWIGYMEQVEANEALPRRTLLWMAFGQDECIRVLETPEEVQALLGSSL